MPHQRDIFTSGALLPDKTGHEWFGGCKAVKAAWEVVVQMYVSSACFSPVQIINKWDLIDVRTEKRYVNM